MTKKSNIKDYQYLIIAGTTKAATSSLFSYLAEHPEVCPANKKETRFFLDPDYPLPAKYRFEDGIDKYDLYYPQCTNKKIRLEASPEYLYSQNTPEKIKNSLSDVKFVFTLREPISRLISWYKFAKQNNDISHQTTFDEYVSLQLNCDGKNKRSQYLLALEQGRYSSYLLPYFTLFGYDKIHISFFEDLSNNPTSVIKEICIFANIDPDFYDNYDFQVVNRTEHMKYPKIHKLYNTLRYTLRNYTHNKPFIHSVFRNLRPVTGHIYQYLNVRPSEKFSISPLTEKVLKEYYEKELLLLEELVGKKVPWRINYNRSVKT